MAKPPAAPAANSKFRALVEEAMHGEKGRLYKDLPKGGDPTYSLIPGRAPSFTEKLVLEAVKLGLFEVSETGGRHGCVYLTKTGAALRFGTSDSPAADEATEEAAESPAV